MPLCRCLIHTIKPGKKADRLLRETGKNFAVIFVCAIQPGGILSHGHPEAFPKTIKSLDTGSSQAGGKASGACRAPFWAVAGFWQQGAAGLRCCTPPPYPALFFLFPFLSPFGLFGHNRRKKAEGAAPMKGTAPSAAFRRPSTARRYTSHAASLSREGRLYRHFLFNAMFFLLLCGFPPNEASADKRQPTCRFPA